MDHDDWLGEVFSDSDLDGQAGWVIRQNKSQLTTCCYSVAPGFSCNASWQKFIHMLMLPLCFWFNFCTAHLCKVATGCLSETMASRSQELIDAEEGTLGVHVPTDSDDESDVTCPNVQPDERTGIMHPAKRLKINDDLVDNVISSLKTLVPTVFRSDFRNLTQGLFISLYGGVGHICSSQLERGRASLLFDVDRNDKNDLGTDAAQRDVWHLLGLTVPGSAVPVVSLLGIDLPCSTWSRARGGGHGPPAIRNDSHIYGLPGVRQCDQRKLESANQQLAFAILNIRKALDLGIPGYLENPLTSYVWKTAEVKQLLAERKTYLTKLHMCQYGTTWKKATALMIWGVPEASVNFKVCRGAPRGLCSRTASPHECLRGIDSAGKFRTSQAQVYPVEFANALTEEFEKHLRKWL